jgi:hypothetical protein
MYALPDQPGKSYFVECFSFCAECHIETTLIENCQFLKRISKEMKIASSTFALRNAEVAILPF